MQNTYHKGCLADGAIPKVTSHLLSTNIRTRTTAPLLSPAGNGIEITTRKTPCPVAVQGYQQPIDNEYSPTWSIETTFFAREDFPTQPPHMWQTYGSCRMHTPRGRRSLYANDIIFLPAFDT